MPAFGISPSRGVCYLGKEIGFTGFFLHCSTALRPVLVAAELSYSGLFCENVEMPHYHPRAFHALIDHSHDHNRDTHFQFAIFNFQSIRLFRTIFEKPRYRARVH